jgi:arylsulfatase A-like enzyme
MIILPRQAQVGQAESQGVFCRVAAHPTQDYSIPPIAHHDPTLQSSPYVAMDTALAQTNRLFYYAAISWVDSQIGRVLNKLEEQGAGRSFLRCHFILKIFCQDRLGTEMERVEKDMSAGLTNETLVILHSDHGWSLGESGQWQKFTNFENGARVPLIVRAPWIEASIGQTSRVLAELVDV